MAGKKTWQWISRITSWELDDLTWLGLVPSHGESIQFNVGETLDGSGGLIDSKSSLVRVMAWHHTINQAITWTNDDSIQRQNTHHQPHWLCVCRWGVDWEMVESEEMEWVMDQQNGFLGATWLECVTCSQYNLQVLTSTLMAWTLRTGSRDCVYRVGCVNTLECHFLKITLAVVIENGLSTLEVPRYTS